MLVVDSHCHLDFEGMEQNLPGIMARAEEAGVGLMVSISSRVRSYDNLRRIAEENSNVFFTIGTHPHNAHEELGVTAEELVRLAQHPKCVGIGEVGLDYHYDLSPREAQDATFFVHRWSSTAARLRTTRSPSLRRSSRWGRSCRCSTASPHIAAWRTPR